MKDTRFVELLNVYLDGEISEAETAELEREIRSSATRMELYRSYCKMQKACEQLAEHHSEVVPAAVGNVVRFPVEKQALGLGQWWRGAAYAGTAAVAATVILVISMSGPGQTPQAANPERATTSRIVQIPVAEFSRSKVAETRLASLNDRWSTLTSLEASTFPVSLNAQAGQFAQAPEVETEWGNSPILRQGGPIEFRYRTVNPSGARVLHGQTRLREGEVEFATFQFAR